MFIPTNRSENSGDADDHPDGDDPAPRHRRAAQQHEQRERGQRVAQRRQQRRDVVEADLDRDEVEAPDCGDEDGEGDVARAQAQKAASSRASPTGSS
jgi:hypothetical protein